MSQGTLRRGSRSQLELTTRSLEGPSVALDACLAVVSRHDVVLDLLVSKHRNKYIVKIMKQNEKSERDEENKNYLLRCEK